MIRTIIYVIAIVDNEINIMFSCIALLSPFSEFLVSVFLMVSCFELLSVLFTVLLFTVVISLLSKVQVLDKKLYEFLELVELFFAEVSGFTSTTGSTILPLLTPSRSYGPPSASV